jgi:vacuolar-type H+-ATPase subunit I/STV1
MDLVTVLAHILGIVFVVVGLALIFNKKGTSTAIENIAQSLGLIWVFGFLALAMGAVFVALNNVWDSGLLSLFITIVGWLAILKGAFLLIFPSSAAMLYKKCNKTWYFVVIGLIALILGLILLYR